MVVMRVVPWIRDGCRVGARPHSGALTQSAHTWSMVNHEACSSSSKDSGSILSKNLSSELKPDITKYLIQYHTSPKINMPLLAQDHMNKPVP